MAERLDHFMARANAAYYASRDPLLEFATSPEISQIFGELLGALAIDVWGRMGAPPNWHLIEAGPGRGTLMADIWRTITRLNPAMASGGKIHFIETSPILRAQQRTRVPHANWHTTLADVPAGPTLLFANEFLDALPIRQFVRTATGWAERYVQNAAFVAQDLPGASAPPGFSPGDILEVNEPAARFCTDCATRVLRDGGAAILIDYGHTATLPGDTLQALLAGQPADPLAEPGSRDLTAHIDFAAMSRAARAALVHGPVTQGAFLTALGLPVRAKTLADRNPSQAVAIRDAADRLCAPTRMGDLFKVLAISNPNLDRIAGFPA